MNNWMLIQEASIVIEKKNWFQALENTAKLFIFSSNC